MNKELFFSHLKGRDVGVDLRRSSSSQAELGDTGVKLGVGWQPRDSASSLGSSLLWLSGLFPGAERKQSLLRIHRLRAPIFPGIS